MALIVAWPFGFLSVVGIAGLAYLWGTLQEWNEREEIRDEIDRWEH